MDQNNQNNQSQSNRPQRIRLPIFRVSRSPAPVNMIIDEPATSALPVGVAEDVPVTSSVKDKAPGKRMSFTALDEQFEKQDNQAKAPLMTSEQKTKSALHDLRIKQSIKTAKKVKTQLDMSKFGLINEAQWLLFSPIRYDDYVTITSEFSRLNLGNMAVVRGTIVEKKLYDDKKRETSNPKFAVRLFALLKDERGRTISVNAYGKPGFSWRGYEKNSEIVLRCKPQRAFSGYGLELSSPEIVDDSLLGQVVPVYPPLRVTKGSKFKIEIDRHLDKLNDAAQIVENDSGWKDPSAPVSMSELTGFSNAKDLLRTLHRPTSVRDGEKAMRGAKLISAYTLIHRTAERAKAIKMDPKSVININPKVVEDLKARLPYRLTGDQHTAIDGICASLRSSKPMNGLLSGDVGTGKTAAFLLPMIAAHKAGKRVMLLTPNLLLISQVVREMTTSFPEIAICTVRGKGGVQGDPHNSIVIGTTALINAMAKGKVGSNPDFLVVDEQHKFSVEQRETLKLTHTNKLEATATPIPRTAALAIHGAHDLFLLRDVPVQKKINTEILVSTQGKAAGQHIIEALRRGEQAAVIYPLVTAAEDEEGVVVDAKKAVNNAAGNWRRYVPLEEIAVLHGKMKDAEKDQVLDDFREGRKKLLLSSIVIEVGVTLPDLKTMLVTNADRFGVVTLHQLRGRLARHGGQGHFVLFTENEADPDSMDRLQLVAKNTDGFDLAEKDAEVRGYGDLLGIDGNEQSGATRTLFQGVKIGPRDVSFAANIHEKKMTISQALENINSSKKTGLRPA